MKIGIGLPATISGVQGSTILEWARLADIGPFSSLGTIDRIVYPNYEPLITLAVVAGATHRIRLMTTILLAPIRNTAILAKEAATLDALSEGRLVLGLGIGARPDDFEATQSSFKGRGSHLGMQIKKMRQIWAGQPMSEKTGPVGPAPVQKGGPEILVGGYTPNALRRAGRLADGYISGGGADPVRSRNSYDQVEKAWQEAGRQGKPRFVGAFYSVIGPELAGQASAYLRSYYGPMAENMVKSMPDNPQAIRQKIQSMADVGMDEIILWPTVSDLDQLKRYADIVSAI